jgi:cytochrome c551/c552
LQSVEKQCGKGKFFFRNSIINEPDPLFLQPVALFFPHLTQSFVYMTNSRFALRINLLYLFLISAFLFPSFSYSQDGKALFQQKCAACHAPHKNLTGPALAGVEARWPDKDQLYAWINNSQAVIKNGYPYAVQLYNQYNKIQMNAFPELTVKDIDAILAYVNSVPLPGQEKKDGGATDAGAATDSGDNSLLFGILTLILAAVALILLQVNSNLRKMADESEGVHGLEPVPFYRNKFYIALGLIGLFMIGGYFTIQGAIGLGRMKDYQPEQPIYYSHKVHAGINQVNCLYCHGGAEQGKHSNIPSVNVCMNCHAAINEYVKGPKLYTEEGMEVDGTAEIKKLYEYAGWNPDTKTYSGEGKPIEWIRIHNLPDHVYFNHAQHVKAGKVQCQTCHGEIQKMDEVYQYSDLSMGWCINCHRESKVQFTENKYYSIYEKFHEDIRNGKMDSVTVEKIGGLECQKCHY